MKRLRRLLRTSQTDRRLLFRAALLLGATRVGLWLLPFQTLRRALASVTWEPTMRPHGAPPPADRIAWAVGGQASMFPRQPVSPGPWPCRYSLNGKAWWLPFASGWPEARRGSPRPTRG